LERLDLRSPSEAELPAPFQHKMGYSPEEEAQLVAQIRKNHPGWSEAQARKVLEEN
jgi:hypothetical protein